MGLVSRNLWLHLHPLSLSLAEFQPGLLLGILDRMLDLGLGEFRWHSPMQVTTDNVVNLSPAGTTFTRVPFRRPSPLGIRLRGRGGSWSHRLQAYKGYHTFASVKWLPLTELQRKGGGRVWSVVDLAWPGDRFAYFLHWRFTQTQQRSNVIGYLWYGITRGIEQ